jgi:outer membrane receptor protein involved in Fe transport
VARQLEVGYNYTASKINFDIKAFVIDLSQTIIAGENPDLQGVTVYNNSGSGFRNGVEASIDLNLSENWSFLSSASYNQVTLQYANGYAKIQPLTPDFKFSFLTRYTNQWIDVNYLHLFVSLMYLNSANTIKSPTSLDAQITISTRLALAQEWTFGIQVNNA